MHLTQRFSKVIDLSTPQARNPLQQSHYPHRTLHHMFSQSIFHATPI